MDTSIEKAVIMAAEAAMAHMVVMNRMSGAKVLSEGALYETINGTIKAHTSCWVNHEHRVSLNGRSAQSVPAPGDVARVDFGIGRGKEKSKKSIVTLLEIKLAARAELRPSVNVDKDMQKLYASLPYQNQERISEHAYLIVLNLHNSASRRGKIGSICWNEPPAEALVDCIETLSYSVKDSGLVYTASVFRVNRK